ncbi:MAG: hypothetical protein LUG18_03595 [Candidatus Azobacteroides sp.]|nr:hypothetical protein [Candidatus Azobacteroides sp.]
MVTVSDKNQYFQIIKNFEYIPYSQTEGWYCYINNGKNEKEEKFIFILDDQQNPEIACFGYIMKFFGLKLLMITGECIKKLPVNRKTVYSFYEKITSSGYDFIEVNSPLLYSAEYEIGIRKAGYLRPVGFFSMPVSKLIFLQAESIEFSKNWRKNLKKAEKNDFHFEVKEKPDKEDIFSFFNLYKILLKEKNFYHHISKNEFEYILSSPDFGLAMLKENTSDELIAGFIFFKRNQFAQSVFRAKSVLARNTGATFYIYIKLLEYLKDKNYLYFDMGRLVPSIIPSLDGVFDFKDGLKGEYILYNGEWAWYKKKFYRPLMYFVKKILMKKREA